VPCKVTTRIDEAPEATDALLGAAASDTRVSVTVNAGLVRGGTKINLVANHREAEVDIRLQPGASTGRFFATLTASCARTPGYATRSST
jgi:hypothetical protein